MDGEKAYVASPVSNTGKLKDDNFASSLTGGCTSQSMVKVWGDKEYKVQVYTSNSEPFDDRRPRIWITTTAELRMGVSDRRLTLHS